MPCVDDHPQDVAGVAQLGPTEQDLVRLEGKYICR